MINIFKIFKRKNTGPLSSPRALIAYVKLHKTTDTRILVNDLWSPVKNGATKCDLEDLIDTVKFNLPS